MKTGTYVRIICNGSEAEAMGFPRPLTFTELSGLKEWAEEKYATSRVVLDIRPWPVNEQKNSIAFIIGRDD